MRELPKNKDWCNTCEYFIQHYVWSAGEYMETDSGHCILHRHRRRRGSDPACENWAEQTEEYRERRTPLYEREPEQRMGKTYCIRVQVVKEP